MKQGGDTEIGPGNVNFMGHDAAFTIEIQNVCM